MKDILDRLILERTGPDEATIGTISIPLPKDLAEALHVDHSCSDMLPIASWERHRAPTTATPAPEEYGARTVAPHPDYPSQSVVPGPH